MIFYFSFKKNILDGVFWFITKESLTLSASQKEFLNEISQSNVVKKKLIMTVHVCKGFSKIFYPFP